MQYTADNKMAPSTKTIIDKRKSNFSAKKYAV